MRYLLLLSSLIITACAALATGKKRLKTNLYKNTTTASPALLVLLPGLYDRPRHFARAGFIEAARSSPVTADLMTVNASHAYYRSRTIVTRLHHDVIGPAQRAGYQQIWLVGISLGGLGALLYLQAHSADVAGVVLLSPYLGEKKLLDQVAAAGSLAAWQPAPECTTDPLCGVWQWLQTYSEQPAGTRTPALLGYGQSDRFAQAHELLAHALGRSRTVVVNGGHNWTTWRQLWDRLLTGPLADALATQRNADQHGQK